jgi:hypothetical protein
MRQSLRAARLSLTVLALALGLGSLAGCGSGASNPSDAARIAAAKAAAEKAVAARKAAEARAPRGASPTLRAIYATFPPPKPNPEVKRSAAAIKAGEKACKEKTPTQVKAEFYAAAKPKLVPEQTKMVDRIATYESHSPTDPSFTAGQLAADVYQTTLPVAAAQYGYQGCVYSLAQGLERRLAPER